jgi:YVTN family beta-propeller protein
MTAGSVAIAIVLALAPLTNAATLTNSWKAKIGSSGVNGTATLNLFTTGTGQIALKLAKLQPSKTLAVTLLKTSCSGKTLLTLASIKTSSKGAATRTTNLTVAQANSIKAATKGTAKIAVRIGSSTTAKCGVFTVVAVPAYLAATIAVGPYPSGVAISPTGVWVANFYNGTISRISPDANTLLSTLQAGEATENVAPDRLVFAEGSLWFTASEFDDTGATITGHSVRRLDLATGLIAAKIPMGAYVGDIAASPGAIWVTNFTAGTVIRIDTATNQVAAAVTLAMGVAGVAFGAGSIWVSNEITGAVSRIDPSTNTVIATVATVGSPEGIAFGAGAIWVSNWGSNSGLVADGLLSRIDPLTNMVTKTVVVGTNPFWIAYGGGSVWVALHGEPSLVRVNATTMVVTSKLSHPPAVPIGPDGEVIGLGGVIATDHTVWVVQSLPAPDLLSAPPNGSLLRVNY